VPVQAPAQLFYSYSHKDEKLRDQLEAHLSTLKRERLIAGWHDRRITAGTEWKGAIDDNLKNARIILLLVTANFLASDYCNDVELKYAMKQHRARKARVIPVILRPCDWHTTTFAKLQALPTDGKAVIDWKTRDKAFLNVVEGIRKALKEMPSSDTAAAPTNLIPAMPDPSPQQTTASTAVLNALHQLPTPPADFTGRKDELKELLEAVKTGGVTISGLQGLGGVGKTALALKLAEQLKPDYPDAQFYLDLKGVSPQPLTPRDAMAYIVRAYHPTAQLPEKDEELTALYRAMLDGKRALLLMDNARDAQQVAPLIPPASCLLLVTSRRHFTLPGLFEKNLDKLPHADARSFLLRVVPRLKKEKPAQVDDLAHLCSYLPMALRAVGSALEIKKNISPADYTVRLQEMGKNLVLKEVDPLLQTTVGAALQSSYELLSKSLQQNFRFLSVFPDTFDLAAASTVWKIKRKNAENTLGDLMAYSLIEFNEISHRYELHDLTRLFTRQLLNPEELYTAQKRHAGHYLAVMQNSDVLYKKGGDSILQGLRLIDVERPNIETGQKWVVAHQEDDDSIAEWCFDYPHASVYCNLLRQSPRERIQWFELALTAARRLKQLAWEGNALGNLGIAYNALGEYHRAIEYHEQNLKIARQFGDRQGEASALGNLGNACSNLGEYDRAIKYHEKALVIDRDLGNRLGEEQDLGNLGNAYYKLGEFQRAIKYYEQCIKIAREISDRHGEAETLFNSALALNEIGERSLAISGAEAALRIYEALETPTAAETRDLLAEWRAENKAPDQDDAK
jgi:tetratricopeptide (TPR) repeat protein